MMAMLVVLLILLAVTAAGVWGVDSREDGDWTSPRSEPFRSERRFD